MRTRKAYKFRIYPNKNQEVLIIKAIGRSRFAFNHKRRDAYYRKIRWNVSDMKFFEKNGRFIDSVCEETV